jgi:hypothetical protein
LQNYSKMAEIPKEIPFLPFRRRFAGHLPILWGGQEEHFFRIFANMNHQLPISRRSWIKFALLLAVAVAVFIFSFFPASVEKIYSVGIYPAISGTQRMVFKWIPFSIGDLIYIAVAIRLLVSLVRWIIRLFRKQYGRIHLKRTFFILAKDVLWIYVIFKLVWGLNYDRLGIQYQLGISKTNYTKEEVMQLTNQLIDKVNESRRLIKDTVLPIPPLDSIYREAFISYQTASYTFDFLNYGSRSVKASLFSSVGDYMGFSGYYNPFTGEAQLRTDIPRMLIPYITTHEMAHQLGYASESEANFVGYLAAAASTNPYFRYSLYNDLFSYAQGEELFMYGKNGDRKIFDSVVQYNRSHLDTLVKKERREVREFFHKRRNRISPAVSSMYDQYLKMNKQNKGIESYNEVIGWLISYQKKYGKL